MPEVLNQYALTSLEMVNYVLGRKVGADDEALVLKHINAVSARFEGARGCQRKLKSRTYVHDGNTLPMLRPRDATKLILGNPPITGIATLKADPSGSALSESTDGGQSGDFILVDMWTGLVELLSTTFLYPSRFPVVACTYTGGFVTGLVGNKLEEWGWETVAADVELAVARQVAHEIRVSEKGYEGVTSVSESETTISFTEKPWLPQVMETIKGFRLTELP